MVTEESNSGLDWETEESWWQTPAAIGFIIGVALGFIVLLVFLGVSLYACCTQKDNEDIEEDEGSNSGLDWNEDAERSDSGTLTAKSQIATDSVADEDLIEVIEEDSKEIEDIV